MKDQLKLWIRITICSSACLLGLILSSAASTVATAQEPDAYWFDVRTIETANAGIVHPRSAVYTGIADQLLVLDGKARATTILSYGKRVGSTNLPISARWRNVAFDAVNNRLLVFDRNQKLLQLGLRLNLSFGADTQPVTDLDLGNSAFHPQGIAYDSATARLWVLEGETNQLLQTAPGSGVSKIDLNQFAQGKLRGLAFNPANQHLYTLALGSSTVYEFTDKGDLVVTRNLSTLHLNKPRALLFAPSSDNTDNPAELSLYIVEKGAKTTPGGILELSLTPPPVLKAAAAASASLVHTTVTGDWSPNAPDPAGVIYQPDTNHLLISDSEVEEMPNYFVGKNMFEARLGGSLTRTFTSFTSKPVGLAWNNYTDEPTGLALNPDNNHLFVSEDSNNRVYEIDPRGDGILGTSDDTVTKFSTSAFGDTDTEDVAYGNGKLFVVDGAGKEVYIINPGNNGRFDGVPPGGDDSVTHFDVEQYGVRDAEGLGFNSENNNLIVVDRRGPLVEVTQGGALVQSISLSFLNPIAPADVAVAPSSNNSSIDSLYIVDRMVDNNDNANETDGRLYEITLGGTPPPTRTLTPPPTVTNTPIPDTITPTITPVPNTITPTFTPTPGTVTPTFTPATPTPTFTPNTTGNLVRNPGFEVARKNQPTEWSSWRHFFQSNELVHSENFAGKFAANDNSGTTIKQVVKNLNGGTSYNTSGWVNIPPTLDNFTFMVQLKWRDASNHVLRLDTVKNYTTFTLGWDQASGTFVSPAGTTDVQVLLKISSLDATIYVDDFSLTQ